MLDSKNVMDALTQKTKEYLGTSDNCQTSVACMMCAAFIIMVIAASTLFG